MLGERVKEEGIRVYRPAKVTNLLQGKLDPETTDVIFEDGQIVRARYVIGADGTKSIVSVILVAICHDVLGLTKDLIVGSHCGGNPILRSRWR